MVTLKFGRATSLVGVQFSKDSTIQQPASSKDSQRTDPELLGRGKGSKRHSCYRAVSSQGTRK